MATKKFYFYVRENNVLTNATSVTITIKEGVNVLVNVAAMTNDGTGIYSYQSADIFSEDVTYTVEYVIVLGGNTYNYSESFRIDSEILLFSIAELKTILELTETNWDNILDLIAKSVTYLFENYMRRKFESSFVERYYIHQNIFIRNLPINSIASITKNSATLDYTIIDKNTGWIKLTDELEEGDEVIISYTGGLEVNEAIKSAALYQAAYIFKRNQSKHIHINEYGANNQRNIYKNEELLPMVKLTLNPYIIHQ